MLVVALVGCQRPSPGPSICHVIFIMSSYFLTSKLIDYVQVTVSGEAATPRATAIGVSSTNSKAVLLSIAIIEILLFSCGPFLGSVTHTR